jgi:hypothetical protein
MACGEIPEGPSARVARGQICAILRISRDTGEIYGVACSVPFVRFRCRRCSPMPAHRARCSTAFDPRFAARVARRIVMLYRVASHPGARSTRAAHCMSVTCTLHARSRVSTRAASTRGLAPVCKNSGDATATRTRSIDSAWARQVIVDCVEDSPRFVDGSKIPIDTSKCAAPCPPAMQPRDVRLKPYWRTLAHQSHFGGPFLWTNWTSALIIIIFPPTRMFFPEHTLTHARARAHA